LPRHRAHQDGFASAGSQVGCLQPAIAIVFGFQAQRLREEKSKTQSISYDKLGEHRMRVFVSISAITCVVTQLSRYASAIVRRCALGYALVHDRRLAGHGVDAVGWCFRDACRVWCHQGRL